MANLKDVLGLLVQSNVTKVTHRAAYPAVDPSRPELSQKGRVVLITGGGTGVGYAIAQAFVAAAAVTVIIVGRRGEVLAAAASKLEAEAQERGTTTKVIHRVCDVSQKEQIEVLWADLAAQRVFVDVLVANAVKFTEPRSILELGVDEIWSQMEANVKGPLYMTEKFHAQVGERQKFIVHVSTQAVHMTGLPGGAERPGYVLSKLSGTLLYQLLALNVSPEEMQIVNFHPGLIYNGQWAAMGIDKELFDREDLCGGFAVWAASSEAKFLHGRFVWAGWDIEELSSGALRKRIDEDPYFLRASIVGLHNTSLA